LSVPTVTTPGVAGLSRRETIDCSADTTAASATIGSLPRGARGVRPAPMISIVNVSAEAASGPSSATTCPTVNLRSTCPPKIARASSMAPLSSTARRALSDLLGRLQHYEHVALGRVRREQSRRTDGPRCMDVVSARVHPPETVDANGSPSLPESGGRRCLRAARRPAPSACVRNARDSAGLANAPNVGHPDVAERLDEAHRRISLGERQLGMTMKLASKRHEAIPQLGENRSPTDSGAPSTAAGGPRAPRARETAPSPRLAVGPEERAH
jgi:hypothetical protein